jgi:hypothetical protein
VHGGSTGWDTLLDESSWFLRAIMANIEKTTRTKVRTSTAACVREYSVVHLDNAVEKAPF